MRPGQRVDVQSALAVGDFAVEDCGRSGPSGTASTTAIALQRSKSCMFVRINCFADLVHSTLQGSTVNFMCMPSCSSLQITVQTTSYSPGSVGAVR